MENEKKQQLDVRGYKIMQSKSLESKGYSESIGSGRLLAQKKMMEKSEFSGSMYDMRCFIY